jgi:translation initiation factor 4A
MQKLDLDDQRTQILIMAHTKELANQTFKVVKGIGLYLKCSCHVCTGGTKVMDDKNHLKEGA